jgi:hypothetical protein
MCRIRYQVKTNPDFGSRVNKCKTDFIYGQDLDLDQKVRDKNADVLLIFPVLFLRLWKMTSQKFPRG